MKFTLTVDCGNSCFDPNPVPELKYVLRRVAEKLTTGMPEGPLLDSNGNKVGEYKLSDGQ